MFSLPLPSHTAAFILRLYNRDTRARAYIMQIEFLMPARRENINCELFSQLERELSYINHACESLVRPSWQISRAFAHFVCYIASVCVYTRGGKYAEGRAKGGKVAPRRRRFLRRVVCLGASFHIYADFMRRATSRPLLDLLRIYEE